jgi:nucleotide-binding universal stress UspA family protein
MFKNILVAVDGSEHALKAARVAGDIARSMDANLRVVTVYEPLPSYLGEPYLQRAISEGLGHAQSILKEALTEIGSIPGVLETETLEGSVAEAILAILESRNIDLVVMGTRGLGRLASVLLGSQSQKVVQLAPCPVLLMR